MSDKFIRPRNSMPFPPFNLGKGREDRFSVRQDYLCLSFEYMGLTVHSDNDEHQSSRSWIFVRFSSHVLLFNYPRLVFDNAHPINFLTKNAFADCGSEVRFTQGKRVPTSEQAPPGTKWLRSGFAG